LSDFGLAQALENGRNSYAELGLPGVAGTIGYVFPECFHTGKATPKSDVFGFGAVVLEVVCGRSPGTEIDHHQRLYSLVEWVWMLHCEGNIQEAVDGRLHNEYVVDEAERLLFLGLACSHPIASERPQAQAICQIIGGSGSEVGCSSGYNRRLFAITATASVLGGYRIFNNRNHLRLGG
jgi:serine/threonine protein kinase